MKSAVTATLVGSRPGRPPMERLLIDLQLRNDDGESRWALLPTHLPLAPGGIDKLEQLTAMAGATRVAVGRFLGTGGRYAVRLAPGARVMLRRMEVAWWRDDRIKKIAFDVQFAREVQLGGETMAGWFDRDPTVQGWVEVDMQAARHTSSHRASGDKEVALSVSGAATSLIRIAPP